MKITKQYTNRESQSLDKYLQEIGKVDLLTPDEEIDLAIKIKKGDQLALERLVKANLRFVVSVAKQYQNQGLSFPDLVNEGNLGLIRAANRFDETRGFKFISYAVWWIRAYIQNYIMRSWSLVKIGTTQMQKKLFFKLAQTRNALLNQTGSEDLGDIARELDVSEKVVAEMSQRMGRRDTSLDVELTEGEGYTLLHTLPDKTDNQEALLIADEERKLNREKTAAALSILNPRERHVIKQRILADPPFTLQDIADEYGVSRERIRQLEHNALQKLRKAMTDEAD